MFVKYDLIVDKLWERLLLYINNRMNCYEQTKIREEDRSNNKDNINEKEQINQSPWMSS